MRVITAMDELEAMPRRSVLACIYSVSNEPPLVVVFQRGSEESPIDGWYTPGVVGAIDSHALFRFLMVNQLPYRLSVLWEPAP
jgi:hypothetical protein